MRRRSKVDVVLVVLAAVLAYTEVYGWTEPAAGLEEFIALFAGIDITVYIVIAGVVGIIFVGYVAVYLPKRMASQNVRDRG